MCLILQEAFNMPHENPVLNAASVAQSVQFAPISTAANVVVANPRVQAIEEALAISSERTVAQRAAAEGRIAKTSTATGAIVGAIDDITSAQQIVNSVESAANLQAQNATIAAFDASGGTDAQVLLMQTLREEGERTATLLDEKSDIVDDEFTGIQIIDGVINSFRSVQTDIKIQASQQEQAQTVRQIQNISAATESFSRTNALTKKSINEATIQAQYTQIAAEGTIKKNEAEIKGLNSNAVEEASNIPAVCSPAKISANPPAPPSTSAIILFIASSSKINFSLVVPVVLEVPEVAVPPLPEVPNTAGINCAIPLAAEPTPANGDAIMLSSL